MSNAIMLSCVSGHIVCRACEGTLFNTSTKLSLCPICRGGVSYVKSRRVAVLNNIVSKISTSSTCTDCCDATNVDVDDCQSYTTVDAIICPTTTTTTRRSSRWKAASSSTTPHGGTNDLLGFVNEAERLIAGAARRSRQHQQQQQRGSGSRSSSRRRSRRMNVIVEDRSSRNIGVSCDDAIVVD
eukprot:CAMPEP_0116019028 /NCGR_PEP_ID=MMETSP0321-20121206/8990_1 /TAXON_ID=163516 /ORGANISM="Leptocylindrus danicus var. danicus, Strain B650" /LENGTH=183 /DNA_ID=CAMNT_0003489515 /DNA_START=350 /DNA_END=901 /DNA_ORIENTATION=-